MSKKPDSPARCAACNGRGYTRCDCWPGDCICGWGDEDCEACFGIGFEDNEYPEGDPYEETEA